MKHFVKILECECFQRKRQNFFAVLNRELLGAHDCVAMTALDAQRAPAFNVSQLLCERLLHACIFLVYFIYFG
jgi:hypothetical protein